MLNRDEKIQERAYLLWEKTGYPDGADWDHWFEAERQVDTELRGSFKPKKPAKPRAKKAGKAS